MRDVRIVPIEPHHIIECTGAPFRKLTLGIAAIEDGKAIAVAVIYPEVARLVACLHLSPQVRAHPMSYRALFVRGRQAWDELLARYDMPVHAEADEDIEGAHGAMAHYGFQPWFKRTYHHVGRDRRRST